MKAKELGVQKEFWAEYERRVAALEAEGLTRSDAQGVVDLEEDDILETVLEERK